MRQQRDRQQITLEQIADRTKIKLSLLEALERDDVSRWPLGIFRRAFIRAYAKNIGLEPDAVVREFLDLYPEPAEDPAALAASVAADAERRGLGSGPPTRLRYVVGTAMSFLARRRTEAAGAEAFDRQRTIVPSANGHPLLAAQPAVERVPAMQAEPGLAPRLDERPAAIEDETDAAASATFAEAAAGDDAASRAAMALAAAMTAPVGADLEEAARLCAEMARVDEPRLAAPWLEEAARMINAVGVIVWEWVPQASELRPAVACGYSDQVLAQLPKVRRDTDNATAAAFRSGQTCSVNGTDAESGAVVVPMMTAAGCVGVLAAELEHGRERQGSVRALLTIFAAQLARLVGAHPGEPARKLA
jgi:transcriptional regulator with XRE-family HTH domain